MGKASRIPRLKPGDDIAGKYTIEARIGEGGMGVVFKATHRRLSQLVAIKMLLPHMLSHAEIVGRFEREARAAGQLRSRHIVRVLDVGELPDHGPYMVMEFLHGEDLGTTLDRVGALPIANAVEWVLQACTAMAEAHDRGIIHRDLKPANLFVAEEEDTRILKVLDFGISKIEDKASSSVTATNSTLGTPLYMSPEQVRSTKQVDQRSDIWSLGVILYELLCGKAPFDGAPAQVGAAIVSDDIPLVSDIRPDVPRGLAEVIARALAKRREERWAGARELAAALLPYSARTPSQPELPVLAPAGTMPPYPAARLAGEAHAKTEPIDAGRTGIDHGWTAGGRTPTRTRVFALAGGLIGLAVLGGSVGVAFTRLGPGAAPAATTSPPAASIPPAPIAVAPSALASADAGGGAAGLISPEPASPNTPIPAARASAAALVVPPNSATKRAPPKASATTTPGAPAPRENPNRL